MIRRISGVGTWEKAILAAEYINLHTQQLAKWWTILNSSLWWVIIISWWLTPPQKTKKKKKKKGAKHLLSASPMWCCLASQPRDCLCYRSFWIYQKYAYIVEKTPPKIIGETRLWLHTNLGNRGFILLEFFVHEVSPRSIARSCCISGIGFAAALSALMMGLWIGGKLLVPNLGSWKKSLAFAPSCFFFFFVSLPTFVLLFYFLRYANLDFLFAEVLDVNRSVHHGYSASGWSISLKGCRCIKCRVVEPLCILSPFFFPVKVWPPARDLSPRPTNSKASNMTWGFFFLLLSGVTAINRVWSWKTAHFRCSQAIVRDFRSFPTQTNMIACSSCCCLHRQRQDVCLGMK